MPRPQQTAPTPLTYRPEVAARVLGVSRATLYHMIAKGDLNAYKIGAATVIRHEDLVKLVEGLEPLAGTKGAHDAPHSCDGHPSRSRSRDPGTTESRLP